MRTARHRLCTEPASLPTPRACCSAWNASLLQQHYRNGQAVQQWAETIITLATEQAVPYWLALGTIYHGWALAAQGQMEAGMAQMQQGLAAYQATGARFGLDRWPGLLAELHGHAGQVDAGLTMLEEHSLWYARTAGCRPLPQSSTAFKGTSCCRRALGTGRERQKRVCFRPWPSPASSRQVPGAARGGEPGTAVAAPGGNRTLHGTC